MPAWTWTRQTAGWHWRAATLTMQAPGDGPLLEVGGTERPALGGARAAKTYRELFSQRTNLLEINIFSQAQYFIEKKPIDSARCDKRHAGDLDSASCRSSAQFHRVTVEHRSGAERSACVTAPVSGFATLWPSNQLKHDPMNVELSSSLHQTRNPYTLW